MIHLVSDCTHLTQCPKLLVQIILGGGMLAGIGFTIALFISELAYSTDQINAAKLGIFSASICSALLGLTFLRYFSVREKQNNI
ncbi:hypothetical protein BBM45_13125 [Vibrio parahaemolyticus]|nr:hypothetical protein BBM45_13125 [Vibrio parahaemolyticus]